MQLTIRFSGSKRSDFGCERYEQILLTSLSRFGNRLKQVSLLIEDINGPRGGVDKQCRCVLHLRRMPPIVIEDRDDRVLSLIYRVSNRAAHALSRKMDRRNKAPLQRRKLRQSENNLVADFDEVWKRNLDVA